MTAQRRAAIGRICMEFLQCGMEAAITSLLAQA
jgi:hypothetical protein